MRDADRIEAINSEQLATATDRLLLRASKRFARGSQARIAAAAVPAPARFADGSQIVSSGATHPESRFAAPQRRIAYGAVPHAAPARLADGSQARIVIAPRAEGSQPRIVLSGEVAHVASQVHAAPRAEGSQPRIVIAASLAHPAPPKRAPQPTAMYALRPERTGSVRRARSSQRFALMLMVPTLFGIALGITALL